MDTLLSIHPGLVLWTWVIFILLFLALRKLAWKPILEAIENRENQIAESLKKAHESREEAETLLEKQRQLLENAQLEAQKIIREQKELALQMRQQLEEDARKKIDAMFEKARNEIEHQKKIALQELKDEVANYAVLIAQKILEESLDPKKHEKIIHEYLDKFQQN